MPDQKTSEKSESKSLEMRVAELEDKLAKVHITEEEMKAYHKVAAAMGAGAGVASGPVTALTPRLCTIANCLIRPNCIIYNCIIYQCVNECGGGACIASSGGAAGGFGTLGS
jgi:hypothetical protein